MMEKLKLLTIAAALVFLGFTDSAFAGKDCPDTDTSPKCNRGGGGDDHGDPPAQYCAKLTAGGFDFGTSDGRVTLTRNNRGNAYIPDSPSEHIMDRPGATGSYSQAAWDAVFATCEVLNDPTLGVVVDLAVSDKWEIGNGGGRTAGDPGTPVTVSFKDAYGGPYDHIEVDLHLRGVLPEPGFPLERGTSAEPPYVVIELPEFWFYVHASGTDSCKIISKFEKEGEVPEGVPQSVLRMTWGACD